jgi:hypothetical protein
MEAFDVMRFGTSLVLWVSYPLYGNISPFFSCIYLSSSLDSSISYFFNYILCCERRFHRDRP